MRQSLKSTVQIYLDITIVDTDKKLKIEESFWLLKYMFSEAAIFTT